MRADDVVVAGTGMTEFGMFTGRRLRELAAEAAEAALNDAEVPIDDPRA